MSATRDTEAPKNSVRPSRPAATSRPAASRPTQYVVLRQVRPGSFVLVTERVEASNDTAAIRAATTGLKGDEREGAFVAVPARSFRVRSRAIETVEHERWS